LNRPKEAQPERYVDIKTVAEFLDVSAKTVRRRCTTQVGERIPHYRFCGKLRFKLSEVDEWAARTKGAVGKRRRHKKRKIAKAGQVGYSAGRSKKPGAASERAGKEA